MMSFSSRPLILPPALENDIINYPDTKLTAHLHNHGDNLGDYGLAKSWYQELSRTFNWTGNTMGFQYVWAHYQKEMFEGDTHFRQRMIEDDHGVPVGYIRFTHLKTDRNPEMVVRSKTTGKPVSYVTRRGDCTKIEETTFDSAKWLGCPSLSRHMYDCVEKDSAANGKARIVTELAVGFTASRFGSIARRLKRLGKSDELTCEKRYEYERLKRLFRKDWVTVTQDFAEDIRYTPIDSIVPENLDGTMACQMRIHHVIPGARPLELPDYRAAGRICKPVRKSGDFDDMRCAIEQMRERACDRHGLNPQTLDAA